MLLQSIYSHLFPERMEKERDAAILSARANTSGSTTTNPYPVPYRASEQTPFTSASGTLPQNSFAGLGASISGTNLSNDELVPGQTTLSDTKLQLPTPSNTNQPNPTTPSSGLGMPELSRPTEEDLNRIPEDTRTLLQKAQDEERELRETIANPQDKDKGFKQRAFEVAQNFLYGLGQAQPGMSKKEALLLGGTAAGAGALNRSFNERRAAENALPGAQEKVRSEREAESYNQNKIKQQQQADIASRDADNARLKILSDAAANADARAYDALKEKLKLPAFDRGNPDHREIARRIGYDPDKVPEYDTRVEQILSDGTSVKVAGKEALEADALRQYRNAQFQFDAGKFNAEQWGKYQTNMVKWATGEAERKSKVNTTMADADALDAQAAQAEASAMKFADENDPLTYDARQAETFRNKAVELKSKAASMRKKAENSKSEAMPPPPRSEVTAPVLSGRKPPQTITRDQLRGFAKKMGWTEEKAEQILRSPHNGVEIR